MIESENLAPPEQITYFWGEKKVNEFFVRSKFFYSKDFKFVFKDKHRKFLEEEKSFLKVNVTFVTKL